MDFTGVPDKTPKSYVLNFRILIHSLPYYLISLSLIGDPLKVLIHTLSKDENEELAARRKKLAYGFGLGGVTVTIVGLLAFIVWYFKTWTQVNEADP